MSSFTFNPRPIYIDDDEASLPVEVSVIPNSIDQIDEVNASSAEIFRWVDTLRKGMRSLVYDFGVVIVMHMWCEGYSSAKELRPWLETWRTRRQDTLLAQDYHFSRKRWLRAINKTGRRRRDEPRDVATAAAEAIARAEAQREAVNA